jgi:hypothetical protein
MGDAFDRHDAGATSTGTSSLAGLTNAAPLSM